MVVITLRYSIDRAAYRLFIRQAVKQDQAWIQAFTLSDDQDLAVHLAQAVHQAQAVTTRHPPVQL